MDKTTYMTDSDRPQGVPNLTPAERREFLQQLEKFEPRGRWRRRPPVTATRSKTKQSSGHTPPSPVVSPLLQESPAMSDDVTVHSSVRYPWLTHVRRAYVRDDVRGRVRTRVRTSVRPVEPTCVGLFEYERTIESVHNGHCAPARPLNTMKNGFQSDVPRHASLTNLRLAVVACSVRCAYRLTRQLNMPPLKTVGARRQTAARRGGVPRQERVNGSRSVVGP